MKASSFKAVIFLLAMVCCETLPAQKNSNQNEKKFIKTDAGYLMVLKEGDNLFDQLELFAIHEKIPSAYFTGMGFAEVEFGYYHLRQKRYRPKKFGASEVASLNGSIAWQEGKTSVHVHGVITGKRFNAHGGHILSAVVAKGSLELMIIVIDKHLIRKKDERLGASILCIENCR